VLISFETPFDLLDIVGSGGSPNVYANKNTILENMR